MITQKTTPNFEIGRRGNKPEIIVIHISAGSFDSCINWFANPEAQVSSHYLTSKKGDIVQFVKEEDTAWTQGLKVPPANKPLFKLYKEGMNPNFYCIGIENEGEDLSKAPVEQINALVELIKDIAKRNNIPIDRDHIIGHYEVDPVRKPNCPATDKSILDKIVKQAKGLPTKDSVLAKIEELKQLVLSL